MRQFKFRTWDGKAMDYNPGHEPGDMQVTLINECFQENNVVWMQCAGLKDKNGKEIYEGDICKDEHGTIVEIVWSENHQWGCRVIKGGVLSKDLTFPLWHWVKCPLNGFRQLTVIGNIYSNPELLKEGKE